MTAHVLQPVARLRTPFAEKFGVPRQAGLAPSALGRVEFLPPFSSADFVRGLNAFSHIWLITGFHQNPTWEGASTVRPPRLGGNTRVGVFASRSPLRPNGLGLSLVQLVEIGDGHLIVAGIDCVDESPVYDLKPYLPWCEAVPDARADWADHPPARRDEAAVVIPPEFASRLGPALPLVRELLSLELHPAYQQTAGRTYGMTLAGWNLRWQQDGATVTLVDIHPA